MNNFSSNSFKGNNNSAVNTEQQKNWIDFLLDLFIFLFSNALIFNVPHSPIPIWWYQTFYYAGDISFENKTKKTKENNANKMANFNWISRIYLAFSRFISSSTSFRLSAVWYFFFTLAFKSLQLTMIHFKFMQANFPKKYYNETLQVGMIITKKIKIVWFDNDEMVLLYYIYVFFLLFKSTHYYWINKVWMEMFI